MSTLSPLGPTQLSFLPHAPTSPNPRPASLHRSKTGQASPGTSPKSIRPLSKSAPSSPSGRNNHLPAGLAPLSMISPIVLDAPLKTAPGGVVYPSRPLASAGMIPPQGQGQGQGQAQGAMGQSGHVGQGGRPAMISTQSAPPVVASEPQSFPPKSPKANPYVQPASHVYNNSIHPPTIVQSLHHPSSPHTMPPPHSFPNQVNAIASSSRQPYPGSSPMPAPAPAAGTGAPHHPRGGHSKSRSRSRPRTGSTSEDTETEVDSDSTFVPGRMRKTSVSSPNLMALRNRLDGWAGDVAREQSVTTGRSRAGDPRSPGWVHPNGVNGALNGASNGNGPMPGLLRRKTPPRPLYPIPSQPVGVGSGVYPAPGLPSRSPKSSSSLGLRTSPSPRSSTLHMSSLTSIPSRPSSDGLSAPITPNGGVTGSEDADDDYDGDSISSSGSLTFNAKARRGLRQRLGAERTKMSLNGGLGLSLGSFSEGGLGGGVDLTGDGEEKAGDSLFGLRLLAIFPAVWGSLVLLQAFILGGVWCDVYPWGVDTSREALDRLISGRVYEGTWGVVSRGDMLLSIVWAALTGHFCFDLTTGLTHRWRIYYDLPATITRLLSIQCICQPLTGLTLWLLGPKRTLLAWVVIGCSTAWSRCVQMYVTSNIISPHAPGDTTPGASTNRRRSNPTSRRNSGDEDRDPLDELPGHLGTGILGRGVRAVWTEFSKDRIWDWAAVAQEVGWKVGLLLMVTNAWMFWGVEVGRWGKAGEVVSSW